MTKLSTLKEIKAFGKDIIKKESQQGWENWHEIDCDFVRYDQGICNCDKKRKKLIRQLLQKEREEMALAGVKILSERTKDIREELAGNKTKYVYSLEERIKKLVRGRKELEKEVENRIKEIINSDKVEDARAFIKQNSLDFGKQRWVGEVIAFAQVLALLKNQVNP